MSNNSRIEWTGKTWNPIGAIDPETGRWGCHCEKVGPGCKHCYAEAINLRLLPGCGTGLPYTVESTDKVQIKLDPTKLLAPTRWRKPTNIFVCSMTDLFGEFVAYDYIKEVHEVMRRNRQHTFQMLSKRSLRMKYVLRDFETLPNLHVGVSVENEKYGVPRIAHLRDTPAAVRWVSYEPALEFVHPDHFVGLDWVVMGGESGHHARPCDPAWFRFAINYLRKHSPQTQIFVKQLGSVWARQNKPKGVDKWNRKGGDMSLWPEDLLVREFPQVPENVSNRSAS